MSSPNQTMAAKNKKQPKTRRSLKKKTAPHPVDPDRALAIDMSKNELDNIFLGLHTGELENPQAALSKVYLLAIDSIEKTLLGGISEMCNQFASNQGMPSDDNPLAPWISQLLPLEPEKIQAFQDNLKIKFDQAKQQLKNSISQAMAQDADGKNIIGSGEAEYRKALIDLLSNPGAKLRIPFAKKQLSDDRLSELYQDIQIPAPDDGKKRYHFTKMPGSYRFSFGSNSAPQVAQTQSVTETAEENVPSGTELLEGEAGVECESESTQDEKIDEEIAIDSVESESKQESSVASLENECIPNQDVLPTIVSSPSEKISHPAVSIALPQIPAGLTEHPIFQAIADTSLDLTKMAREVTDAMTELAIQIGNEAIKAFAEDHLIPKLSESLKDDPRFSQDEELCAFIDTLEDDSTEMNDPSYDSIDNDELAKAFATLFDEFED